jgi:hypothetical protein
MVGNGKRENGWKDEVGLNLAFYFIMMRLTAVIHRQTAR